MIALIERKCFGRCSVIAGLGHVETEFWGLAFFPMLPTQSLFVFTEPREPQAIPLHAKSLTLAYLRAVTGVIGVALVASTILFPFIPNARITVAVVALLVGVGLVGAALLVSTYLLQPVFDRTTPEQAAQLRAQLERGDFGQ